MATPVLIIGKSGSGRRYGAVGFRQKHKPAELFGQS